MNTIFFDVDTQNDFMNAIKEITVEGRDEAFVEFEKTGIKLVSSKWVFDNCQKALT